MSKRLMPTYLIKFLENLYNGNKPLDFTRVMVTRQFIAKLKELYEDLGGNQPANYTQVLVPKYLQDFFNELEIIEFDDDDVSQEKTIPGNLVYPACRIDSIGGMSYKTSINLFNSNLIDRSNTSYDTNLQNYKNNENYDIYGPFSVKANETYTISGTNTMGASDTQIVVIFYNNTTIIGNANKNPQASSNFTLPFTTPANCNLIYVSNRKTNTNVMLNIGPTALPYQPYESIIQDSAVTAVKSYGANLLHNIGVTGTENGLTFTINNGNINVAGTPTSSYAGRTYNNYFADNSLKGTYTLKNYTSDFPTNMFVRLTFVKNGSRNYAFNINANVQTRQFTFDGTETSFRFEYAFQSETLTAQNGNIKPMITEGSAVVTEFKPYKGLIDTYTVPSAITSLAGYGQGINSTVYNNVDFASGKYTKKIGVIDLGTLNWNYTSDQLRFYTEDITDAVFPGQNTALTNVLCSENYNITTYKDLYTDLTKDKYMAAATINNIKYFSVRDTNYTTAEAFKAAMDGVLLYYELKTPVETTITENAPLLEVESGGTVVLDNEYNNDVPSEVVTWIKES